MMCMKCVQKHFGGNICVHSKLSYVGSSHDLCARAHAHSLEETLLISVMTLCVHVVSMNISFKL